MDPAGHSPRPAHVRKARSFPFSESNGNELITSEVKARTGQCRRHLSRCRGAVDVSMGMDVLLFDGRNIVGTRSYRKTQENLMF